MHAIFSCFVTKKKYKKTKKNHLRNPPTLQSFTKKRFEKKKKNFVNLVESIKMHLVTVLVLIVLQSSVLVFGQNFVFYVENRCGVGAYNTQCTLWANGGSQSMSSWPVCQSRTLFIPKGSTGVRFKCSAILGICAMYN